MDAAGGEGALAAVGKGELERMTDLSIHHRDRDLRRSGGEGRLLHGVYERRAIVSGHQETGGYREDAERAHEHAGMHHAASMIPVGRPSTGLPESFPRSVFST